MHKYLDRRETARRRAAPVRKPASTALAVLIALTASAGSAPAAAAGPFDRPVGTATLASVRGGFLPSPGGVALTLNLQQSVFVNGTLAATSGVQLWQRGAELTAESTGPALVQLGSGNRVALESAGLTAAAVVQNSLDNQHIRTVTRIDVSATILRAYGDMQLQSTLNGAITGSLRR